MNPKYYKGLQSVASCQSEDLLEWDKLFQGIYWLYPAACITTCTACSLTRPALYCDCRVWILTQRQQQQHCRGVPTQQEGAGAVQNPAAAQQDNVGPMDRPLPIRRRQRKPDRRNKTVVQAVALPPPAPAHKRKRGRKPKTKGRTSAAHPLVLLALLPVLCRLRWDFCVCLPSFQSQSWRM